MRHGGSLAAASAPSTPASPGCFRRTIPAVTEPCQSLARALPGSGRCTVHHPELVSVVRLCLGNLSGFRHAVRFVAHKHTRKRNCGEVLELWTIISIAAPYPWIGISSPILHCGSTITLDRPSRLEIISESHKDCRMLHPHSRCLQSTRRVLEYNALWPLALPMSAITRAAAFASL
ncbi:hypothetical protein BU25DRAFT_247194 [Macroventuria anomochaeta]|uniref:Uncharacterized protein n=1 Tax=Macroventuria anomochaeta TaxID=301207 RepID=A0ACB6S9V9_9PLEO|nr:uncharacterized protein BU25DRAFT_247194 [Macroventuria anomochaeta]KAF2630763.1 hypothetical protein BU25DRAFT_247194 [Macroventuria anomochaeta]